MISKEFFRSLDLIAEERGISRDKILEVIRKGLESAYKKDYDNTTMIRVDFDIDKNKISVFGQWEVVSEIDEERRPACEQMLLADARKRKRSVQIGDIIEEEVTPKDFGRIAALTAKNVLMQGLKQLERDQMYDLFSDKENEMVTGVIASIAKGFLTIDLGNGAITSLPEKELLPADVVHVGDRIKLFVTKVEKTTKGPKIYVSRTDAKLVTRLMEQVIPELADGTIEIVGIARDAGDRCKICVMSNDPNVDAIGACLGRGGERIKEVIESLNGEKIDLFRFSDDNKELIKNSLQPSDVIAVLVTNSETKEALAIVPNDQLSLAIGKRGQNVRLAVNAISWKIDIKSEQQAKEMGINF